MTRPGQSPDQVPPQSASRGQDGAFPVPWTWVDAVGAYLLSLVGGSVIGTALLLALGTAGTRQGVSTTVLLVASPVVLAAGTLAWLGVRFRSQVWRLRGPRLPAWRDIPSALGLGLLIYLVVNLGFALVLEVVLRALGIEVPPVQESFREAIADPAQAPLFLASAVLLAPFAEELFYRGLLFQGLRTRVGLWPAVVISSIVFGASHLNSAAATLGKVLLFLITAALGAAFAWVFHRRGTLLAPIIVHGVVNLSTSVLLWRGMG